MKIVKETGSKETRAEPVAAQWQAGNFDIITADWNEAYFSQLESFPESKFKVFVFLAVATGARRDELLGLQWSDVNFTQTIYSGNSHSVLELSGGKCSA